MKIDIDGAIINYALEGSPASPVVTFSHALGANVAMWDLQACRLRDRYRVLRYDVRGHGASSMPAGGCRLTDLTGDVRRLLRALGISRTHFVGLSLGGIIGQALVLEAPELVEGLVLANTTSRIPAEAVLMWDERARIALSQGMGPIAEMALPRWLTEGLRAAVPAAAERIRGMILTTDPAAYVACYRAIERFDVTERLRDITAPTLVIAGAEDLATPTAAAADMHHGIIGSELVVLTAAAHLSNIDQPDAFSEAVARFLDRVEA